MKKGIATLLIIVLSFYVSVQTTFALTSDEIHSNEALLVNMNTDEVIFHKDTNPNRVPIASLTKLMTYAVVLDEIPDLENTRIVVPDGLVDEMKARYASRADLIDGYEYSALDLLYGMMLPSGCDAAETLARYIGNGDPSVFVAKMNQKAQALGMYNTQYIDSYGIGTATEENESTEEDQYKLIKYLYNKAYFKQIISTEYYVIYGTKDDQVDEDGLRNTNYLIGQYSGGAYYNPYSIGGKTGSLDVAGKCLITVAQKGDLEVVAITLGVPGEARSSDDYNLTDHNKLFDYAFGLTQNITIDLGPEYRSVEAGKMHKIEYTTSEETTVTWTSDDPSVATIDENGIVTGVSQGQTTITANTSTGNLDYTIVSVDFYNGVHTKYSTGPSNGDGTWGPIDYSIIKNKGFDYVIIRAGYGDDSEDRTFLQNFQSAVDNEMNIGIWFEGYAETVDEAEAEANNLVAILNKVSNLKDKINLPVLYNLYYLDISNPISLLEITSAFQNILNSNGYDVMLELGRTKLSTMDLETLAEQGVDLSVMYRSLPPDFKTTMQAGNTDASIWNYKVNAYLGNNLGTNGQLSLMYMKYKKIPTIHKEYVEEQKEQEQETVEEQTTTETQTTIIYASKCSNKQEDNQINTNLLLPKADNKLKSALEYEDDNTEVDVKEQKDLSFIFILIMIILLAIVALIIKYILDNKE